MKKGKALLLSLSTLILFTTCGDTPLPTNTNNNTHLDNNRGVLKIEPTEDLPNIIFILADDLGFGDLGCYGHPYAKTPNIDALAKEGTLFKKFYSAGATCTPSRTAFMTAKHPATYQKYMKKHGLANNPTITELLQKVGYATAHIGKWHLGPILDNEYGLSFIDINKGKQKTNTKKDEDSFDSAIRFIEDNNNRPFYINLWSHVSHFPIIPPKDMLEIFKNITVDEEKFGTWFNQDKLKPLKDKGKNIDEAMQMYLAEIYSLDFQIGKLMQSLKDQGLEQNTIIVFSSDQGPDAIPGKYSLMFGSKKEERLTLVGYAGGLRGGKHNQYEGGIRVPFIVKWPNKVPMNYIDNNSVISSLDFLPSICSIAGIKLEKNIFDGKDKSNVLYGVPEKRKGPLFWRAHANGSVVSILEGPWKMHEQKWAKHSLFNLEEDPFEENDIAADNQDVVRNLSNKIDAWQATLPEKK